MRKRQEVQTMPRQAGMKLMRAAPTLTAFAAPSRKGTSSGSPQKGAPFGARGGDASLGAARPRRWQSPACTHLAP
nr:hypothetical protein [Trinickia symbiotica]